MLLLLIWWLIWMAEQLLHIDAERDGQAIPHARAADHHVACVQQQMSPK